ncbi:hypothetical protein CRG98_043460 [Punica granatum]|uniref:Uncharacterized protein n=1 Tax=Punica granatum TaxID=22663 RepID=A0A2I0HWU3_PUNGR|nr:hypothetical protein CRG98_043460 [Punica granatum]
MMIARWDKWLSLEEIKLDTVSFWIQIQSIPPEMLSEDNITKLAKRAGKVLEIDWKDTPSLPKWYVTPRVLVKVPVTANLIETPSPTPVTRLPGFRAPFPTYPRSANSQKPRYNVIFHLPESMAALTDDKDNITPNHVASGMYSAHTSKLVTAEGSKGEELTNSNPDFLHRGHTKNYIPKKKDHKEDPPKTLPSQRIHSI